MDIDKEENNKPKGTAKNLHFKKSKEFYPFLFNREFLEIFSSKSGIISAILFYMIRRNTGLKYLLFPVGFGL